MRSSRAGRTETLLTGHGDPEGLGGGVELQISSLEGDLNGGWVKSRMTAGLFPSGEPIVSFLQGGVMRDCSRGNRKAAVNTTQAKDGYSIRWGEGDPEEGILLMELERYVRSLE